MEPRTEKKTGRWEFWDKRFAMNDNISIIGLHVVSMKCYKLQPSGPVLLTVVVSPLNADEIIHSLESCQVGIL